MNTITKYLTLPINGFNKQTLLSLQPYFDLNFLTAAAEEKHQWFYNLLELAQQSLGVAHCLQHHQIARLIMQSCFDDKLWPNNIPGEFSGAVGCYSGGKSADELTLTDSVVNGTKHWVSSLEQADYGVVRVPVNEGDAFILIDFNAMPHTKDMHWMTPIGMEIAKPGSFTVSHLTLEPDYILGYKKFYENAGMWTAVTNFIDYSFITNYLGLIISLHKEFKQYLEKQNRSTDFEFNRLTASISGLKMMWIDQLPSISVTETTDTFWHRRNTQYTMSKDIVCQLISLILQQGDSRWLDAKSTESQRMRDALTFCSHMKPLSANLLEKNFFNI